VVDINALVNDETNNISTFDGDGQARIKTTRVSPVDFRRPRRPGIVKDRQTDAIAAARIVLVYSAGNRRLPGARRGKTTRTRSIDTRVMPILADSRPIGSSPVSRTVPLVVTVTKSLELWRVVSVRGDRDDNHTQTT
jgi:hypothetical protein